MARNESTIKFTETFGDGGGYVCAFDTITLEAEGFTFTARIEFDPDTGIDDDGYSHNVDQEVTGCDDEQQIKLLAARAAWEADEWFYCGVVVSVSKAGIEFPGVASLWGIECNYPEGDNSYLTEVANELLSEALDVGRQAIHELTKV